jgi:hypothetical protein
VSLILSEFIVDQLFQSSNGRCLVNTASSNRYAGIFGSRQHHNTHDALGIDLSAVAREGDMATELAGQFDQLGGRAGVQSEFVPNQDFGFDHAGEVPLKIER